MKDLREKVGGDSWTELVRKSGRKVAKKAAQRHEILRETKWGAYVMVGRYR